MAPDENRRRGRARLRAGRPVQPKRRADANAVAASSRPASAGLGLSSDCLDRWPGYPARADAYHGGWRQDRAPRPRVGKQPYRPPSRDRPCGRAAKKDALRRCI